MDVLSSQATAAGYEAVLLAASTLPRFFPMMTTAAGTIRPAQVLVLGAGVAGLLRRLPPPSDLERSSSDTTSDLRRAIRSRASVPGSSAGPVAAASEGDDGYADEVDDATRAAQQVALAAAVSACDVVITTAQVPGRRAPLLVTAAMVATMKPGTVIVDVAAAAGATASHRRRRGRGQQRCYGPRPYQPRLVHCGQRVEMFSRNIVTLFEYLTRSGEFRTSPNDEIAVGCRVTAGGAVIEPRVLAAIATTR